MTPNDLGRATEARFLVDALERGLKVALPFSESPGYDAVVDSGRRLIRVQVKGARPGRSGKYWVNMNRHGRRHRGYDVVAIWLVRDARWIFIPARVVRHGSSMVGVTAGGKHSRRSWEIFR
jgi:PD-(D/E)XK endonuclease